MKLDSPAPAEKAEAPQGPAAEFNEQDRAFLDARPGIEKDRRLFATVRHLQNIGIAWGEPRFYASLGNIVSRC